MKTKFEELSGIDEMIKFDEEMKAFFDKNGKGIRMYKGKAFVTDWVSEAETLQKWKWKEGSKRQWFSITDETKWKLTNTKLQLCMEVLDAYIEWYRNMRRIRKFHKTRIALWIFLAIPEAIDFGFKDLAKHLKLNWSSLYAQQFHRETEEIRAMTLKKYFQWSTPKVISALVDAASKRDYDWRYNTPAMKLYLQYTEGRNEKMELKHDVEPIKVEFGSVDASPFMAGANPKVIDDDDDDDDYDEGDEDDSLPEA